MPITHRVRQGECVSSIGDRYGFFWNTIWDHPENAELKRLRQDPNVLAPGDELFIPDKRLKEESGATEERHRFRRKGVPVYMKLRLLLDDEPRANKPYRLIIDDVLWKEGSTDGDGYVETAVPPGARQGRLVLTDGQEQETYLLDFGSLDPIDTDEGVRSRLANLGFSADEDLEPAVRDFQAAEELEVTGRVDDATRERLKERAGQ